MKELIRKVLREEVSKRFVKGTPEIQSFIIKQAEKLIGDSQRQVLGPDINYGNYAEEWCKNGTAQFVTNYYFDDDKFFGATLMVKEEFISFLSKMLQVRERFILNTLEEWYDETYVPKMTEEIGHPELEIDEVQTMDNRRKCYQTINTDNLSREEMIDYLDKHTSSKKSSIESFSDDDLKQTYERVYNIQLSK